jgi:8-oxo-dGTP diphosphatase
VSRAYPERPVVGVGAVVIIRPDDRPWVGEAIAKPSVILIKRRFEPLAGQWSLPGGAMEIGETLAAAVAREVAEETGLTVEVGPLIEVIDRIILDEHGRVHYHFVIADYLCRPVGGRLAAGSDVSEAIVVDPDALEPFALTDTARAVIARGLGIAGGEAIEWGFRV